MYSHVTHLLAVNSQARFEQPCHGLGYQMGLSWTGLPNKLKIEKCAAKRMGV
jgi:hypothetical protein